jgi:hypothetical protein
MNNKHTAQMLRDAAKALGRVIMPQAKGMHVESYDDKGKWGVVLATAKSDIEVGGGETEREALYNLMVRLGKRVSKL